MKRFDKAAWNKMRIETEEKIEALKNGIRREDKPVLRWTSTGMVPTGATYRGGSCQDWQSLGSLKLTATCLYRIRAALRGKAHMKSHWDFYPPPASAWKKTELDQAVQVQEGIDLAEGWGFMFEVPEEAAA